MKGKSSGYVLESLDPVSLGKIYAIMAAILGFVYGLFFSLAGALLAATGVGGILAVIGIAAIIILPIVFAVVGFVTGVITAFIYNFAARKVGGIKFRMSQGK